LENPHRELQVPILFFWTYTNSDGDIDGDTVTDTDGYGDSSCTNAYTECLPCY
jgi:hypothetical protein